MLSEGLTINCLYRFHDRYKRIIKGHGDDGELGQLLATIDKNDIECTAGLYILQLMTILKKMAQVNTSALFKERPC